MSTVKVPGPGFASLLVPINPWRMPPWMVVLVVVTSTCLAGIVIYFIYFIGKKPQQQQPPAAEPVEAERVIGIDPQSLESLPTSTYRGADELPFSEDECHICLVEFEEGDALRTLPQCRHTFHQGCIGSALRIRMKCPFSCPIELPV